MSAPNPAENTPTAEQALRRLVESMAVVFDHDWEFTRDQLNVRADPWVIASGATFLNPVVEDESNNWGNRGGLLAAYRRAVQVLQQGGAPLEDVVEESLRARPQAERSRAGG